MDSLFQTGYMVNFTNDFFVNILAFHYFVDRNEQMSTAILKKYIEYNPDSFSSYESLARAYLYLDKKDLAIKYFEKALELKPLNSAIKRVKKMD